MADNNPKPIKEKYFTEVRAQLTKDLDIKNVMAVPKVEKIVVNAGVGKAKDDSNWIDEVADTIAQITGQKPIITKTRMAISNFKIRAGMPIGVKVTLRGDMMWSFLDKLINISLPRTKDFRGINPKAFDGKGNYSLGITDQTIFPEVDTSKNNRLHGLQISIITSAATDEVGYALLKALGMPFKAK